MAGGDGSQGVDVAVPDDPEPSRPSQQADDAPEGYEDLAQIDEGGFAIVYRAHDTRFDRTVALKMLRSDSLGGHQLRRFRAECLATGRVCSHPNIVTVYDAGTTPGHRPWLAMEHCSGGSLARKVATQGPLPVADVISIGARLCSALSATHQAGILHRDVKPHNVLLTAYGEPALADFGIASLDVENETITRTAAYTVVHAAPEILEGKAATTAADIYLLGSTLYTLLAGQAPFAKEAATGLAPLVTRILRGDLPAIARPGVPPDLEELLRWSMARQPQDRPASAAELGASLSALGRRLAAADLATRPGVAARSRCARPISARRLLLTLGGTLGVALALSTLWGPSRGVAQPDRSPARGPVTAKGAPAAARYAAKNVVVTLGPASGDLTLSWSMPIRPDAVATVIYEGTGTARARMIVNYATQPGALAQATLHGLPRGQEVCLSAAHVVSRGGVITNAVSRPVCAVPR